MKRISTIRKTLSIGLGIGLVGGAIWAGWQLLAGPDLSLLPNMVSVARTDQANFYVQVDEVTVAQWNLCHAAGDCDLLLPTPNGDAAASYPATGVSFPDVQQYIAWLNKQTQHEFRLPSTQEWRDMAQEVMPEIPDPIFTDPQLSWASAYITESQISRRLLPTGSYATTAAGVRDLDGNVWEWTRDCYRGSSDPETLNRCPAFYVQGIHESVISYLVRDPARGGCAVGSPPAHLGLRLVSDDPLRP